MSPSSFIGRKSAIFRSEKQGFPRVGLSLLGLVVLFTLPIGVLVPSVLMQDCLLLLHCFSLAHCADGFVYSQGFVQLELLEHPFPEYAISDLGM